jgi:hypothetical protein
MRTTIERVLSILLGICLAYFRSEVCQGAVALERQAAASSTAPGSAERGAIDGDRFSAAAGCYWRGTAGAKPWWWQVSFPKPHQVGAILQINGDQLLSLHNAPRRYFWQASDDGRTWHDLKETETSCERRLFRIHRLKSVCRTRHLRLVILDSLGESPSLREVEFYDDNAAKIAFPDWIITLQTDESPKLSTGMSSFLALARQCPDWERLLAQQMWIGDFDERFVAAEPRPLCAFLGGNVTEWCKRTREPWRGVLEVLKGRHLPMWGACGGAQGMAILETVGVDQPWDCPRCRDPQHPRSPVYTHIGHTGPASCGDYSKCLGERGTFKMRVVARDPVFEGLPEVFAINESHVGQIAFLPTGWVRVVTKGPGALTENQCLRVQDRYIYAAQFHMESTKGTLENSRRIMANFLALARQWGGYNPGGKPVAPPLPLSSRQ